jgi:hypothetical protein
MTASPSRRALRRLLGVDRGPLTEPSVRDGYSVARRAVAGLLGVRLAEGSGQTPLASSAPRSGSVDPSTNLKSHQDQQATRGGSVTATDEASQPRQSTKWTIIDPHPSYIAAEQILAPRESVRAAVAERLATTEPQTRLVLRKHPVVPAVVISDVMTRLIAAANISHSWIQAYSFPVSQRMVARVLDRVLARDLDFDRDRDFDFDRVLGLARDLDLGLARARDDARARARDDARGDLFARTRDDLRARDRDDARAHGRIRALDTQRVLGLARDLARVLARDLDDLDLAHVLAPDLDLDSDRARTLALIGDLDEALDIARSRARRRNPDYGPGTYIEGALVDVLDRTFSVGLDLARELAWVLAQEFDLQDTEGLVSALLAGVLDDFSQADLSGIDLTAVDLVGIRWSERNTRWPPGTDIERLRSASEETEPGSGIFVITRRGGTDRTGERMPV